MSYDIIKEDVPILVKRHGDRVIAGSNNSMMVFGTDRAAPGEATIDSGYGDQQNAGSWHVIVGMHSTNPNFDSDDSFIYLSRKTDVDKNIRLESVEFSSNGGPAAILKSDSVRIVAREDMKISVGSCYITLKKDGKIVLDGNVQLGHGATQNILKGPAFLTAFKGHKHGCPSGGGISTPPLDPIIDSQVLSDSKFVK